VRRALTPARRASKRIKSAHRAFVRFAGRDSRRCLDSALCGAPGRLSGDVERVAAAFMRSGARSPAPYGHGKVNVRDMLVMMDDPRRSMHLQVHHGVHECHQPVPSHQGRILSHKLV
jgi:hypothetical protein